VIPKTPVGTRLPESWRNTPAGLGHAYASRVLVVGPSSEDEMVLAFLQAEVDSPRFGHVARKAVGDMNLVASPRLDEPRENARRRTALQRYRGFGSNDFLFRGFPAEVATWERLRLTRDDLGGLLYAKAPAWVLLSRGSRLVADGAEHVGVDAVPTSPEIAASASAVGWPPRELDTPEWREKVREASEGIEAVKEELGTGRVYPETIIFSEGRRSPYIIAEGHTRATAQFLHMDAADEVEVLVGYAPLGDWVYR
jgi:hypothetical protein